MMQKSSAPDCDLLVVGGGLVGAVAAARAAMLGHRTVLIERGAPLAPARGRVLAINAQARRMLAAVGAWGRLHGRAVPVRKMRVFAPGGTELVVRAFDAGVAQLCHTVPEEDLCDAVGKALGSTSVRVVTGAEVASMSAGAGHVLVSCAKGEFAARLVVGADGAASPTAKLAGATGAAGDLGQVAVVATVTARGVGRTAWQWFADDGIVALLPLQDGRAGVVWSRPANAQDLQAEGGGEAFLAGLQGVAKGRVSVGSLVSGPAIHRLFWQVRSPVRDRVALVGDSFHVFHPLAGQGLGVSLGDVADLLDSIAGGDPGRKAALDDYARRRRLRVIMTSCVTRILSGAAFDESGRLARCLDFAFGLPACATSLAAALANAR